MPVENGAVHVNPDVLPSFFKDTVIVGPANEALAKFKSSVRNLAAAAPQEGVVSAESSPVLLAPAEVLQAYKSNNFSKIKQFEAEAQADLTAVYTNVSTKGKDAWTLVSSGGKEFYMSWSSTGSMWAYTESNGENVTNTDGTTTYQAVVQVGTYSKSSNICGIQRYNLSTTTILVESVIAFIVARAVSSIIADGLGFLAARFAMYMVQAAAEAGLEAYSFSISTSLITGLAAIGTMLVFAIVFIGLVYLWNWLNRKYTIRLQVLNWDPNNSWNADGQYLSNAKVTDGTKELQFTLPKMSKAGSIVTPPGFDPVKSLDDVCYYAVVVWENDNTFMEGCSMSIRMKKNNTDEGFMWAFDCPRFSDNQQAAADGTEDPETYRNNCKWNSNPLKFQILSTKESIPVTCAVNALSGADDQLYTININIDQAMS